MNTCKVNSTEKVPKRIEHMKNKFGDLCFLLDEFDDSLNAFSYFVSFFKPKQTKFLEILLERYYDEVTLNHIAERKGVTREYIRQCEDKALEIISNNID